MRQPPAQNLAKIVSAEIGMPKGQQRSNREAKKPKKTKPTPAVPGSAGRPPARGTAYTPGAPKR